MPKKKNESDFAERLKTCLENAGYPYEPGIRSGNLERWSKKHKFNKSTIHKYVTGKAPKWKELIQLSEIFDVSIDWLLTGQDGSIEQGKTEHQPKAENDNHRFILESFDCLEPHEQDVIIDVITIFAKKLEKKPDLHIVRKEMKKSIPPKDKNGKRIPERRKFWKKLGDELGAI